MRRSGAPSRSGPGGSGRADARVAPRRVERPLTAAEARAAEVRARRAPRPDRPDVPAPPPWEREQWVDDGPLRGEAKAAARRASRNAPAEPADAGDRDRSDRRRADARPGSTEGEQTGRPGSTEGERTGRRTSTELAPDVLDGLQHTVPGTRAGHYKERLATAADALDRGRFADARRMVQPVLRDVPDLAFGHEIAGLALYRLGQWRKAAAELETARLLDATLNHHAVLADCYRALKRYHEVAELWTELREGSPSPALMAEGRIVAAGALADQGDLAGAIRTMARAAEVPKRVRDHHVRQWYVLGDLYDRSGDVITARRLFSFVANADGEFSDVRERLRSLGR